jgi:hypothetical protein
LLPNGSNTYSGGLRRPRLLGVCASRTPQ